MSMNGWTRRDMLNGLVLGAAAAATGKAAEVKVYNTSPNKTDAEIARILAATKNAIRIFKWNGSVVDYVVSVPIPHELEDELSYIKVSKRIEATTLFVDRTFSMVGRNEGKRETVTDEIRIHDPNIKMVSIYNDKAYARVNPNSWSEIPV